MPDSGPDTGPGVPVMAGHHANLFARTGPSGHDPGSINTALPTVPASSRHGQSRGCKATGPALLHLNPKRAPDP